MQGVDRGVEVTTLGALSEHPSGQQLNSVAEREAVIEEALTHLPALQAQHAANYANQLASGSGCVGSRAYAEPREYGQLTDAELAALNDSALRVLAAAIENGALYWAERILLRCAQERAARSST